MEKMLFSTAELGSALDVALKEGASVPLTVTGTSMQPFLVDGKDVVWIRACEPSDIKKGAILLFKRADESFVLHRVRAVRPDGKLLMNGDGQTWCEKISCQQVVAVVTHIEKDGKKKSCDSAAYKSGVALWQALMPVRAYLMKIRKILK